MASSSLIKDVTAKVAREHLSCVICTQVYDEPKTLSCLHSFCRVCLEKYISANSNACVAQAIRCPICRQYTQVHRPGAPSKEWVDQLVTNFHIMGLVSALGRAEVCGVCSKDGSTSEATSFCVECDTLFCARCLKVHTNMQVARSHRIEKVSSSRFKGQLQQRRRFCDDHREKLIELYCQDCRTLTCQLCFSVRHSKCENVVTVEEEAKICRDKLKGVHGVLCAQQEKTYGDELILRKKREQLYLQKHQIEEETELQIQRALSELEKKRVALISQLETVFSKYDRKIEEDIDKTEGMSRATDQNIELVQQLLHSASDCDVIESHKEIYSIGPRSDYDKLTPTDLRSSIAEIALDTSESNVLTSLEASSLGKIVLRGSTGEARKGQTYLIESRPDKYFQMRFSRDMYAPEIVDMVFMQVGCIPMIIVADRINKCLKSFYTKNDRSYRNCLLLKHPPWSLTKINDATIAVGGPHQICIVQLCPELHVKSTITTGADYWGLAAFGEDTLVVNAIKADPPSIHLLDVSSKTVTLISIHSPPQPIFSKPSHIRTTPSGDILVLDSGKPAVICITPGGDVRFQWRPEDPSLLVCPQSVHCCSDGTILAVDSDLKKVIQLNSEGQFVGDLLPTECFTESPSSVCVDSSSNLYVALSNGEVQVYSIE